jgi:pyruvate/2-oxoglutarate dehydrogenase complex dihydrolipoamide dehydrogenase (E3) component
MEQYDAIIIGAGQGGSPLSHRLADLGWKVALIERELLGGTCINWGCTPTKTLIASAQAAYDARRASELGIHVGEVRVDFAEVMARQHRVVQQFREGQEARASSRPRLCLIRGEARFVGPHELEVNGERLHSSRIFIDTGVSARLPDIEGRDEVAILTSKTILGLNALPAHLLILGGSYIGLEFGQMFCRFGSEVTIVEHGARIISREDEEFSQALQQILEGEGIRFLTGTDAQAARQEPDGTLHLTVKANGGTEETLTGTHLLSAIGQTPNTAALNLEAAGVETDEHGYVLVNDRLETSVPGIWAIGDVKGGPAFTHISYNDHQIIYENLVNGGSATKKGRIVPYALFTDPQLGRVGLTERQAREEGYNVKVGSIPMSSVARAIERGDTRGLMKVVVDADTDKLLGASILSAEGGELVQALRVLMLADAPWTFLKGEIFIHPTLTEGFFALFDAVK